MNARQCQGIRLDHYTGFLVIFARFLRLLLTTLSIAITITRVMSAQIREEHQSLPNTDRLSVVVASILLAYAFLPFVNIPSRVLVVPLLGVVFPFKVNFATVIALISAGLAALGTDWLLRDHPALISAGLGRQRVYEHWLVPALTAWVIEVPLSYLGVGLQWWVVLGFGGLLLVMVFMAEYIAVDPYDNRYAAATIGLTSVSYALFLILVIALVGQNTRLYVLVPALFAALFLLTLRNLHLRLGGRWCPGWSFATALIVSEAAAALHYLPLTPLRSGLVVLGLAYGLSSFAGSVEEGRPWQVWWVEPAVMLTILWGLAIVLGK
jgi:hypothetical protein